MENLVSVEKWQKSHIVKKTRKDIMHFYCGRFKHKAKCEEEGDENNVCASCHTVYSNGPICDSRETNLGVGSIIHCPREVCETGQIKIVGDQTHCKPNRLQHSCRWEYLAMMYDPDYPNEMHSHFELSKEEVKKWRCLY